MPYSKSAPAARADRRPRRDGAAPTFNRAERRAERFERPADGTRSRTAATSTNTANPKQRWSKQQKDARRSSDDFRRGGRPVRTTRPDSRDDNRSSRWDNRDNDRSTRYDNRDNDRSTRYDNRENRDNRNSRYDNRDHRNSRYENRDHRSDNRTSRYDNRDDRQPTRQAPEPAEVIQDRYSPTAAALPQADTQSFSDLGLDGRLVSALAGLGAASPFPIQSASIPAALAGGDVLGRGRTGSGKTIAFGAPMTQRIAESHRGDGKSKRPAYGRRPRGLILAPTRELAMQINKTMEALTRSLRLFTCTVVGGVPQQRQVQNLRRGVDIVIGTPGRLEDLIEQGKLDLSDVMITVLDEADHMCDLGFLEPVQRLLAQTRPDGQRMLFSATLDKAVESLVNQFLTDPSIHEVAGEDQASGSIDHRLLLVDQREKVQILRELAGAGQKTLIFARTKAYAESLSERLAESGLSVTSLHGDLTQAKRSRNLQLLTSGKVSVLVATDVAARGIHVDDIGLVIQADPPNDHKTYLHRSGRTGRAGREGTVVTLSTRQKRRSVENLLRNAEITATPTSVRPGDEVLAELAGA